MLNVETPLPVESIISGCRGDLWLKNVVLILACGELNFKRGAGGRFCTLGSLFPRSLKRLDLDQPTVDNGGFSRGRSVAAAVGCCHFNSTLMALQGQQKII